MEKDGSPDGQETENLNVSRSEYTGAAPIVDSESELSYDVESIRPSPTSSTSANPSANVASDVESAINDTLSPGNTSGIMDVDEIIETNDGPQIDRSIVTPSQETPTVMGEQLTESATTQQTLQETATREVTASCGRDGDTYIVFAEESEVPLTFAEEKVGTTANNVRPGCSRTSQIARTPFPDYPRVPFNVEEDIKQGILRYCVNHIHGDYYYGHAHGVDMIIDKATAFYNASVYLPGDVDMRMFMECDETKRLFNYLRELCGREPFYYVNGQEMNVLNGVYMHGLTLANVVGRGVSNLKTKC